MKSQFFKVVPNPAGTDPIKPKFLWVENPDEMKISLLQFSTSSHFLNGTKEIVPAQKEDPDFQAYVLSDITQVQKDIDKLEFLKENLVNAMR